MIRTAVAAMVTAGLTVVAPVTAHAVIATGTDPTGDISIGGTFDITQFGIELTDSVVTATIKTAAPMPALSDPSWATTNNNSGRALAVTLGPDLGDPAFVLTGDGVVALSADVDGGSNCNAATQNIAGDTITLSAPAECFRYPGKIRAQASLQRGVTPSLAEIDLAIAPQVTADLEDADVKSVDVSLPGGHYQLGADGGVFAFGDAPFYGSTGNLKLNQPVVAMAAQAANNGYRFVASDGGVFAYGAAGFYGSMGGKPLNKSVVGMARTPSGNGYWLVASDGGIFAYGDAGFYGSTGSIVLNKPIVGMVPTTTGLGYWLVASDGGIFAYGDAQFFGSTGSIKLNKPIVGMAANNSGKGYVLVAKDGGVFSYGDSAFFGSGANYFDDDVVGIARNGTDTGYYIASASGEVRNYGKVSDFGDVLRLGVDLNQPIVGVSINR